MLRSYLLLVPLSIPAISAAAEFHSSGCAVFVHSEPTFAPYINDYLRAPGHGVRICNGPNSSKTGVFRLSPIWQGAEKVCHFVEEESEFQPDDLRPPPSRQSVSSGGLGRYLIYSSVEDQCRPQGALDYFPTSPDVPDEVIAQVVREWRRIASSEELFGEAIRRYFVGRKADHASLIKRQGIRVRYLDRISVAPAWWKRAFLHEVTFFILGIQDGSGDTYMVKFLPERGSVRVAEITPSVT